MREPSYVVKPGISLADPLVTENVWMQTKFN